jgi:hypothetical protein
MSPHVQFEFGILKFDVTVDAQGITLLRGPMRISVRWEQVTGAALVRELPEPEDEPEQAERSARAAAFAGGAEALARMKELRHTMRRVSVAYLDELGKRQKLDVPVPAADPSFLQEFQVRLGQRWLGEVADQRAAEKKLRTGPSFFKKIFVLAALLVIVGLLALFGLFSVLGPVFQLLSIQGMLQDFQDGEYAAFAAHVSAYALTFAMGYLLHLWWRGRLSAISAAFRARRGNGGFPPPQAPPQ